MTYSPITFYCGVTDMAWNHHPTAPGSHTCISPVYGKSLRTKKESRVKVPADTSIILDSGAFSDLFSGRTTFEGAMTRQLKHAEKWGYADQVTHRASYDLLIDEMQLDDGTRKKQRWEETPAWEAVMTTIAAAQFASQHRRENERLILSAQGVTPSQYLECSKRVIDHLQNGDYFGLGGWCILGMNTSLLPAFRQTISLVIPYAASQGVKHVHIWGVMYPQGLGELLWICDKYGLTLSTDSSGAQRKPYMRRKDGTADFGYAEWRDSSYKVHPTETRGLERARHVELTRQWLGFSFANFAQYIRPPLELVKPRRRTIKGERIVQMPLFTQELKAA